MLFLMLQEEKPPDAAYKLTFEEVTIYRSCRQRHLQKNEERQKEGKYSQSAEGYRTQPRFHMPGLIPARQGSRECKQSTRSVAGRRDIRVFIGLIISTELQF
jgi:hypothetical protein